jgi:3-phenylpropionate/cinnamic acid dioxygenase small subunit
MKTADDAIAELIYTYAERLDLGDYEGLADLFSDATVTYISPSFMSRGRAETLARYTARTRKHADGTPRTKHVTTNLIVDVDEAAGTATARSYFTVFQQVGGQIALQPINAGRYHDRFVRVGGCWQFASRQIISDLAGDLSAHVIGDSRSH